MSKKVSVFWLLTAVVASMFIGFVITFGICEKLIYTGNVENPSYVDDTTADTARDDFYASKLAELEKLFRDNYIGELDIDDISDDDVLDNLMRYYVAQTGDLYAIYMNAEEYADYLFEYSGNLVGIGVNIRKLDDGKILIVHIMPDSPAEKYGLQAGDVITAVNGKRIVSDDNKNGITYTQALENVAGEENTQVILTIRRNGNEIDYTLLRAVVENQTVLLDISQENGKKTACIRITNFNAETPLQFKNAVDEAEESKVDSIIFDVRGNPGGLLSSVCAVLTYVFPDNRLLLEIEDTEGEKQNVYSGDYSVGKAEEEAKVFLLNGTPLYNDAYVKHEIVIPCAILVNEGTASAGELFTAVMRDYKKAVIVGENTYGKGCMQTTFNMKDGSVVNITYRLYNPPCGINYDKLTEGPDGIAPDIEASLTEEQEKLTLFEIKHEDDAQYRAALDTLYAS